MNTEKQEYNRYEEISISPGMKFHSFKALGLLVTELGRDLWEFECRCGQRVIGYKERGHRHLRIECHSCGDTYNDAGEIKTRDAIEEYYTKMHTPDLAKPMNSAQRAEYIRELEKKHKSEEELNTPVHGAVASDLDRPNILVEFNYNGTILDD